MKLGFLFVFSLASIFCSAQVDSTVVIKKTTAEFFLMQSDSLAIVKQENRVKDRMIAESSKREENLIQQNKNLEKKEGKYIEEIETRKQESIQDKNALREADRDKRRIKRNAIIRETVLIGLFILIVI